VGNYTTSPDPDADRLIDEAILRVCDDIDRVVGGRLAALLLVGACARGEAGAYRDDHGLRLVDDLELLALVRGRRSDLDGFRKAVSARWSQSGGQGPGVSLELAPATQYRWLQPRTAAYYEMAHSHQVIAGDAVAARRLLPAIRASRLTAYEGTTELAARGSGLLLAALYFLRGPVSQPQWRVDFQVRVQRACQAMGDAVLLMHRAFHASYEERLHSFMRMETDPRLPQSVFRLVQPLYEWGLGRRLSPRFQWPGDQRAIALWFEVRDAFRTFFLWFESERLGRVFPDAAAYAEFIERHGANEPLELRAPAAFLRAVRSHLRRSDRGTGHSPSARARALALMPLLLFSLECTGEVDGRTLRRAAPLLEAGGDVQSIEDWNGFVTRFLRFIDHDPFLADAGVLHDRLIRRSA
jgi:hypothetical protein